MKANLIKKILFIFLLALFLMPLLNQYLKFIDSGILVGIGHTPNPTFAWKKWWDGSYQKEKEQFINDSIGFRQDFVRTTDQLDFWLLLKGHPSNILFGKGNYLYEEAYITTYCGTDYNGEQMVRDNLKKFKYLQDTFTKMGKQLVLVYAPSKARFYPNNFPFYPRYIPGKHSQFSDYLRIGDSLGVRTIDINDWFVSMRDTTRHLLMSKQGIHWTTYGSYIAGDSLIKYISRERKIQMPQLVLDKIIKNDNALSSEADLAKLLNLVFPVAKETFSYPIYHYIDDSTKTKPNVIYIGDSFIWGLLENNMPQKTNSNWEYWSYFNEIWDQKALSGKPIRYIKDYDWMDKIKSADCVMIIYNEPNLWGLGLKNSFIDSAYNYFKKK